MTTVKKPTSPSTPTTTPSKAAAPKPHNLRIAERAAVAEALSKLLGKQIDPKSLTGRMTATSTGGSFAYRSPQGRSEDVYGMFALKNGVFSAVEVNSGDPANPRQLFPKPATGFTPGATTTPAVVTNPTGTPVKPPVAPVVSPEPTVTPVTLPPLTLPALAGDERAQAAQFLDVFFRAQSKENNAGVFTSWANSNRFDLQKAETDYASQRARADSMKKYQPFDFLSYDMVAKATGERVDTLKKALGENLQKAAQSAAEGKQLRDALQAWTTQGDAVVTKLMKDDPAAFLQLRNAAMVQNGLTPPPLPPGATGPNGTPLTLSPNDNQYGANAQGHANMLAADPSGSRWSYVNPTPVTSQTNPWSDTGRLP